jgi:hypothetical protein
MARQEQRSARKDYPEHGIKKGDQYWFAQIKTGPRSSRIIRSLKRIPQSQLTTSPFKSGWFAMQEAWEASSKEADDIRAAAQEMTDLGDQAQESFDNMPEGLQQGENGQEMERCIAQLDSAIEALDEAIEKLRDEDGCLTEDGHAEVQTSLETASEALEEI